MYKITVTDKASKKAHIELRTPNRKVLWDEAMKHREYSSLLIRRTRSESASKEVHKPGNNDAVLILKNQLFVDHEVRKIISSISMRYDCSDCCRSNCLPASANTSKCFTKLRRSSPVKTPIIINFRRRRKNSCGWSPAKNRSGAANNFYIQK